MKVLRGRGPCLLLAAALAFFSANAALAQLSRCRAAYPCAIPFWTGPGAESLLAGQYGGGPGHTFLSVRAAAETPLSPQIVTTPRVDEKAVAASVRAFLKAHPAPGRKIAREEEPAR